MDARFDMNTRLGDMEGLQIPSRESLPLLKKRMLKDAPTIPPHETVIEHNV